MPLADLYRRATADERSTLTLEPGEFVTAVEVPRAPDASAYVIAGERAAWSFALVGVAAARFGDDVRMAAIGVVEPAPANRSRRPGGGAPRPRHDPLEAAAARDARVGRARRSRAVSGPIPDYVEAAAAAAASRRVQRHPRLDAGRRASAIRETRRSRRSASTPIASSSSSSEGSLLRDDDQRLETLLSVGANTLANGRLARPGARLRGLQLVLRAAALPAVVRRPRARPERHRRELLPWHRLPPDPRAVGDEPDLGPPARVVAGRAPAGGRAVPAPSGSPPSGSSSCSSTGAA